MAKQKKSRNNPQNATANPSAIGKKEAHFAHESSKLKKELAEKLTIIDSLTGQVENLKLSVENSNYRLDELKRQNNPLVIIDTKDDHAKDIERLFYSKELNTQMIDEIKKTKLELINAEADAQIRVINAESNSPEAQREMIKLRTRLSVNKWLIILSVMLIMFGGTMLYLHNFLLGGFIGGLGLTLLAIGIAHFNSSEDIEIAKKVLEMFPRFPRIKDP